MLHLPMATARSGPRAWAYLSLASSTLLVGSQVGLSKLLAAALPALLLVPGLAIAGLQPLEDAYGQKA